MALLGDVASLGGVGPLFTQKPFVEQFLHQAEQEPSMQDVASCARRMTPAWQLLEWQA